VIHALVVAGEADDRTFKVECPGVTDYCRTWTECGTNDGCDPAKLGALAGDGDDQPVLHGKRHRHMSAWMAETSTCFIAEHSDLRDAALDLWYGELRVPTGRHPIEIEHDPDDEPTDLRLRLVEQPDGLGDEPGLPDPARAAERVGAYIEATGDGVYDMTGCAPLYARDLEALVRAATAPAMRTLPPGHCGAVGCDGTPNHD
jgi:hypothetical protein